MVSKSAVKPATASGDVRLIDFFVDYDVLSAGPVPAKDPCKAAALSGQGITGVGGCESLPHISVFIRKDSYEKDVFFFVGA